MILPDSEVTKARGSQVASTSNAASTASGTTGKTTDSAASETAMISKASIALERPRTNNMAISQSVVATSKPSLINVRAEGNQRRVQLKRKSPDDDVKDLMKTLASQKEVKYRRVGEHLANREKMDMEVATLKIEVLRSEKEAYESLKKMAEAKSSAAEAKAAYYRTKLKLLACSFKEKEC